MDGYDVVTSDDKHAGKVVGEMGDNLIVEHGMFRKTRSALPRTFAEVHDDERTVRATVSKEMLDLAPTVQDGEIDEHAVAEHYGLAEAYADPETEGYGSTRPDDPAWSAEVEERRTGVDSATEERAQIRERLSEGTGDYSPVRGRPITPPFDEDQRP